MSGTPASYPTSAFEYALPHELIARHPVAERDASRLLVLERASGAISDRIFRDIVDLIPPGDALVLNETRVMPARLLGKRAGGGAAEVLLLHPHGGEEKDWDALVRPASRLPPGRRVAIARDFEIEILSIRDDGTRTVRLHTPLTVQEALQRYGQIPLPPYMERAPEAEDRERYQTVYARAEGSVAAPTAGLHFTPSLLDRLREKDVSVVRLVLHVGAGTFRPVDVEDPDAHPMHAEWYEVSEVAAARLRTVKEQGGSIWAVGTTVARTLESAASPDGVITPASGWTRLFIRPPYRFRVVDHLITNFHLPRSTLMMLVAAFAGYENTMSAYAHAVEQRYRFYSYGDAMVIV